MEVYGTLTDVLFVVSFWYSLLEQKDLLFY